MRWRRCPVSRVNADRGELERIKWQLNLAKHVLEADVLANLVTHPLRNAIIELELLSLICDLDKLHSACSIALDSYFHAEHRVDANFDSLLPALEQPISVIGSLVTQAIASRVSTMAAILPGNHSTQGSASFINRIDSVHVSNRIPNLVDRLLDTYNSGQARVRIELQEIDGHRQFTVFIPGTQVWWPVSTNNPLDLISASQSIAGSTQTSAALAVAAAMTAATIGTKSSDRVLFVGHSQGGLIASQLASQAANYKVSGLVTLGAPNSRVAMPSKAPVINIEHVDDPVVYLDTKKTPDKANVLNFRATSYEFISKDNPAVAAHDLRSYRKTAVELEGTTNSQELDLLKQIKKSDGSGTVSVEYYQLNRGD